MRSIKLNIQYKATMADRNIPFITYLLNSLSVGFNMFLDVIPFSITFILVLQKEDQLLMPTINLTMTFFVFAFGYLVGIQEAIGLRCSIFFGQKNPAKFSQSFYRFVFINFTLVCVSVMITVFNRVPLSLLGLDKELTANINILLWKMLPAKIIENSSNLMKGLLISQKTFKPFVKINLTSLIVFSILDVLLIYFLDMELLGFLIAYYIKIGLDFCLLYLTIKEHVASEYITLPGWQSIFQNFGSEFKYTAFISLSQYGEWISVELYTVFAALTGKIENIIAWGINLNMSQYCFFCLIGMSSCLRTYASIELGKRNVDEMFGVISSCIKNGMIFVSILFLIIMFGTSYIIRIYTNDDKVLRILEVTFRAYGFVLLVDFFLIQLSTLLRMIRKEHIQFLVDTIVWPICSFSFGYFFSLYLELENLGLIISFFCTNVIATSILYYVFKNNKNKFGEKIIAGDLSIFSDKQLEATFHHEQSQELVDKFI